MSAHSVAPVATDDEFTCACGVHGTYGFVRRHITDSAALKEDFGSEDVTQAHYLPIEPRSPASPTPPPPIESRAPASPTPPPPIPPIPSIPRVITARRTSPVSVEVPPRSIAELFQDMLRQAFAAGAATAQSDETFEIWYQREILR